MTSPQRWLELARLGFASWGEPMPSTWAVSVPGHWLRTPEPYWFEVANCTISFNHALKRCYEKIIVRMFEAESEIHQIFAEHMPRPNDSGWGGITFRT